VQLWDRVLGLPLASFVPCRKANSPLNFSDRFTHTAVKEEDAEIFGFWGDRVGDFAYFAKAWYHRGHYCDFNTSRGKGGQRARQPSKGPSVKKGERLKRPLQKLF